MFRLQKMILERDKKKKWWRLKRFLRRQSMRRMALTEICLDRF